MIFKIVCILVLRTQLALALEGLMGGIRNEIVGSEGFLLTCIDIPISSDGLDKYLFSNGPLIACVQMSMKMEFILFISDSFQVLMKQVLSCMNACLFPQSL